MDALAPLLVLGRLGVKVTVHAWNVARTALPSYWSLCPPSQLDTTWVTQSHRIASLVIFHSALCLTRCSVPCGPHFDFFLCVTLCPLLHTLIPSCVSPFVRILIEAWFCLVPPSHVMLLTQHFSSERGGFKGSGHVAHTASPIYEGRGPARIPETN